VRVVAESPPLFHIEGDFSKTAVGLCDRMEAIGAHEVVVDSPSHHSELEHQGEAQVSAILGALRSRALDLSKDPRLRQILMFKVRPGQTGPSLHPRWHLISTPFVPGLIKGELNGSARYFSYKERCVLCDYIRQELRSGARLVCEDTYALAVSPYAARFPFEVWVLPTRHSADFGSVAPDELPSFARILRRVATAMQRLPQSQGYLISIHTAPFRRPKAGAWKTIDADYHWHIQVKPRLEVSDGLKESEIFHLNPVPPEEAASRLMELC
jgi:UDPglucose--hexose-1-phosphate uridylyltransferase